jgi:hypothetical protein
VIDTVALRDLDTHSIRIGRRVARRVFEKRGDNSEAHLSETELAAFCALAAQLGADGARKEES